LTGWLKRERIRKPRGEKQWRKERKDTRLEGYNTREKEKRKNQPPLPTARRGSTKGESGKPLGEQLSKIKKKEKR